MRSYRSRYKSEYHGPIYNQISAVLEEVSSLWGLVRSRSDIEIMKNLKLINQTLFSQTLFSQTLFSQTLFSQTL
jgi:hypothetical protein